MEGLFFYFDQIVNGGVLLIATVRYNHWIDFVGWVELCGVRDNIGIPE